ncbi:MAG: TetR/AcrR family transcriptional regulator [Pseudomonadota bacterium]
MPRAATHRTAIIGAAAKLFRRQGYAATGLAEILKLSGAPRGSFYHYFPGGKIDVAVAVAETAGPAVRATIAKLADEDASAADLVRRFARQLADWLEKSDYAEGCPIATLMLELADKEPAVAQAGAASLQTWAEEIAARLVSEGLPEDRAARLARFAIAALEGGMVLTRVERSRAALEEAGEEAAAAIEAAFISAEIRAR